ncbi:MAG: metallophosphoesterase [Lachnospiraceae bacterium]|nr:metallophosphoesterase [Lachnospiraceae bacterium]
MIWFTSDLHLGHRSVLNFCERPFETVEEMNETLIYHYNSCVRKNDTVYILGDIAHRIPVVEVNQLISRLNGKKYLCKGNHDKKYDESLFEGMYDFLEISVDGINLSLMHYPMMEWPKSRHGSLHLHGHIHTDGEYNLQQKKEGILRYDVGVDANGFYPVSIQQIKEFFEINT